MTDVFSIAQGNGFYNPPCPLEFAPIHAPAELMSPKSTESPSVAISLYSIVVTVDDGPDPPIKTERVGLLVDPFAKPVKPASPHLIAFPNDAIVTLSIVVVGELGSVYPLDIRILVEFPDAPP